MKKENSEGDLRRSENQKENGRRLERRKESWRGRGGGRG